MPFNYLEYTHNHTTLEAYIAHPDNITRKLPTVLLFHAWQGRDEFVEKIANDYATKGYVGIALDTFGKGVLGKSNAENATLISPFMQDRALLAQRLIAGVDAIKQLPYVNSNQLIAQGYCFGGLCALDLLRNGVELVGVVSVHGLLGAPPHYVPTYHTATQVLVLTGYNDPMVSPTQVAEFEQEMNNAHVDWTHITYGNTLHAFTNPKAHDKDFGTVYNPAVAKRSRIAIDHFIQECAGESYI